MLTFSIERAEYVALCQVVPQHPLVAPLVTSLSPNLFIFYIRLVFLPPSWQTSSWLQPHEVNKFVNADLS